MIRHLKAMAYGLTPLTLVAAANHFIAPVTVWAWLYSIGWAIAVTVAWLKNRIH